MQLVE